MSKTATLFTLLALISTTYAKSGDGPGNSDNKSYQCKFGHRYLKPNGNEIDIDYEFELNLNEEKLLHFPKVAKTLRVSVNKLEENPEYSYRFGAAIYENYRSHIGGEVKPSEAKIRNTDLLGQTTYASEKLDQKIFLSFSGDHRSQNNHYFIICHK